MEGKSRGMGSRKHGKSGHSGKSPKMRLWEKMKARKNDRKRRPIKMFYSIKELFHDKHTKEKKDE